MVGQADSVTVLQPDLYHQIIVTAPDTVTQGQSFMVDVMIADRFGNRRDNNRFLGISADKVGVLVPPDAVYFANGGGSFQVNSSAFSGGEVTLTVRELTEGVTFKADDKPAEGVTAFGMATVYVKASGGVVDPSEAPAPPNGLIGEDYAGAGGDGDQGGFVMLTWGISDDHNTLDKYRIYREVSVTTGLDSAGNIVSLEEPTMAPVTWGTVDAIPGADIMRVVVATLDSDASRYAVAAERSGQSAFKQAFGVGQSVSNPLRDDGPDHGPEHGSGQACFGCSGVRDPEPGSLWLSRKRAWPRSSRRCRTRRSCRRWSTRRDLSGPSTTFRRAPFLI